jgi:N-acetylneuraminate synthase
MDFDLIKVASCSATDLPLMAEVAKAPKPVVLSTANLSLEAVARIAEPFRQKQYPFALMHCVALYPTQNHQLSLGRIAALKEHFPGLTIGFSTHESPDNYSAVQMAYALGARIFEKHVGIATEGIPLNSYSASPEQIVRWIDAWHEAQVACRTHLDPPDHKTESAELRKLKRGYVIRRKLHRGEAIVADDLVLALSIFPEEQVLAEDELVSQIAQQDHPPGTTLPREPYEHSRQLRTVLQRTISLLGQANLSLPRSAKLEISHHFGLEKIHEVGAVFYSDRASSKKKIIVLLPGQSHPAHFHHGKSELFRVVHGEVDLEVDGRTVSLKAGDQYCIAEGMQHAFSTETGTVIEEESSSESSGSFYADPFIQGMDPNARKTIVSLESMER